MGKKNISEKTEMALLVLELGIVSNIVQNDSVLSIAKLRF